MWIDLSGIKHNGPSPYEQRKRAILRSSMTTEEKHKEKVEEACRWLNNLLYSDPNTGIIRVHPLACKTKEEIFKDFREMMKIE